MYNYWLHYCTNIVGVANLTLSQMEAGTTWAPQLVRTEPVTQTAYIIVGILWCGFYWFQRKLDKSGKKIEQAVSESDRVSEDVSKPMHCNHNSCH